VPNLAQIGKEVGTGDPELENLVEITILYLFIYYLFIYYANNLSRQTCDMNSNTNSKNKLARKTHKYNS